MAEGARLSDLERFRIRQKMWDERAAALELKRAQFVAKQAYPKPQRDRGLVEQRVADRQRREEARLRKEARGMKRRAAQYAARSAAKAKAEAEERRRFEEDPEFAAARDRRRWYEACRKRYRNRIKSAAIADSIDRFGPDDCWEWMGARNGQEYGILRWTWPDGEKQKQVLAHRVALGLVLGRQPIGMVLHSCDNAPCVNPAHLREGTAKENALDVVARNRWTLPCQEAADLLRHIHFVEGQTTTEILALKLCSRREMVRTLLGEKWRSSEQPKCCDQCKPLIR